MKSLLEKLVNSKDIWWGPLVMMIVIALIVFGVLAVVKHTNLDPGTIVITTLGAQLSTLINYRYGASKKDHSTNNQP